MVQRVRVKQGRRSLCCAGEGGAEAGEGGAEAGREGVEGVGGEASEAGEVGAGVLGDSHGRTTLLIHLRVSTPVVAPAAMTTAPTRGARLMTVQRVRVEQGPCSICFARSLLRGLIFLTPPSVWRLFSVMPVCFANLQVRGV